MVHGPWFNHFELVYIRFVGWDRAQSGNMTDKSSSGF